MLATMTLMVYMIINFGIGENMDANNMSADDYLNLYYFTKGDKEERIFKDYKDNFKPTIQDVHRYNARLKQIRLAWNKDKALVHKYIALNKNKGEVKEDNNFDYCMQIGHEFELWVEKECKKYGVDLGMYYDERQFEGENALGLEIKHDSKLAETGNVYIEYLALNKDETEFINGGITKNDNSKYWLIGTEKEYYIFYKRDLLKLYCKIADGSYVKDWGYKKAERRTSKGFIISREKCKELMIADDIGIFLVKTGIIEV